VNNRDGADPRLGYLLAPPPLIQILTNTKAPYNISLPTASLASQAVSTSGLVRMANAVNTLNSNRQKLIDGLKEIPGVGEILGGNHANFVMAQIVKDGKPSNERAVSVYKTMAEHRGVVVRYRGGEIGCEGCLRVTVGSEEEVEAVLKQFGDLLK
jgi:histidinol-phosphate aminotransferase